jgi:type II secretory pathway pseudopilin PulG
MGSSNKNGFTLIETMLFLAITGALVVAVLIGTGASINIQRYRDSVTSLKSLIQKQYSDVLNVQNQLNATNISCDSNAVVATTGTTVPRGQSDCVVMGKYMTINGTDVTTSTVIGHASGTTTNDLSDINLIQSYNLATLPSSNEASQLEWGTQIAWPKIGAGAKSPQTPRSIAILIIRSPQNGQNYTFTGDDITVPLKTLVAASAQNQRTVCLASGGLTNNNDMAISIGANAASSSDIESRSNGTNLSLGIDSQC